MAPYIWDPNSQSLPDEAFQDQEELFKQQQIEEKKRKAQEEQQKLQEEQIKNRKAQPPPEQYGPPGPDTVRQDRGVIGNFVEDRVVDVIDTVDNLFQGDQRSRKEIQGERDRKQAIPAAERANRSDPLSETYRGVFGGIEDFTENTLETILEKNVLSSGINVFNAGKAFVTGGKFEPLDFDIELGIVPENTTAGGDALRVISRYISSSAAVGGLTGGALTAGKTGIGLVRGRAVEGGIEAAIAAEDDGSDDTLLGSTPFTKFLQTSEDNDPIQNRALVVLDEAVFNVVGGAGFDAVGRLLRHNRAWRYLKGKKAKAAREKAARMDKILEEKGDLDAFIQEQAKAGESEEILNVLRTRREAQEAAKVLDDVYDYVTYGGPRTEKVADVIELDTAFGELDKIDQQLSDIDEFISVRTKETQDLIGQSLNADEISRTSLDELGRIEQAGTTDPSPVSLSLSKAQVRLLNEVGLPEGVTITPGRRVQGLNSENIGELTERLNKYQLQQPREKPILFHGSSTKIGQLDQETPLKATDPWAGAFEAARGKGQNIYGQGFYVTDSQDIAKSYTKKGAGESPVVYGVYPKDDNIKLFDLDEEIGQEAVDLLLGDVPGMARPQIYNLVDSALTGKQFSTLGQALDLIRQKGGNVASQDVFDAIKAHLSAQGYGGFSHQGGRLAGKGKKLHNVRIYWDAPNQLDIVDLAAPTGPTESSRQALLNRLLKTGDEALGADLQRSKAVSDQLEQLRATYNQSATDLLEAQKRFQARQKEIEEATRWRDTVRIQREALEARINDTEDAFAGKYIPVELNTKNVTSIRKETPGDRFQPGMDLYFEDKRFPSLLNGKVKEVGFEAGYGNYIVVESIDYRTGKTVDVLYGHLKGGSNLVREGDTVRAGQQIATQGGTGRVVSADGTIASVDFLAPAPKGSGSMKPYEDWSGLTDELITRIKTGTVRVVQPNNAPTPRYSDTYVGADGKPVPKGQDPLAPKADAPTSKAADNADPDFPNAKVASEAQAVARSAFRTGTREAAAKAAIEPSRMVPVQRGGGGAADRAFWTPGELKTISSSKSQDEALQAAIAGVERKAKYNKSEFEQVVADGDRLYEQWFGKDALLTRDLDLEGFAGEGASKIDGNTVLSSEQNYALSKAAQSLAENLQELSSQATVLTKNGRPEATSMTNQALENIKAIANLDAQHKITISGKMREREYTFQNLRKGKSRANDAAKAADKFEKAAQKELNFIKGIEDLQRQLRSPDPKVQAKAIQKANRMVQQMSIVTPTAANYNRMKTMFSAIGVDMNRGFSASILSGHETQTTNFWGSFIQSVGHPSLALLGEALPGKGNELVRRQSVAALGAIYETLTEVRSIIPKLWNNSVQHVDPDARFFEGYDDALTENLERLYRDNEEGKLNFLEKSYFAMMVALKKFYNFPPFNTMFRVMTTSDAFMDVIAGRQMASRRAVERAMDELGDAPLTAKRTREFAELVTKYKEEALSNNSIFNEKLELVDEDAIALARGFTFKADLNDTDWLTKNLQSLSNRPYMKVMGLPFVQTPSAVLKSGFRMTPGLSTYMKNADKAYRLGDPYTRAMMDGREALSYMTLVVPFMLGTQGHLTGAGPAGGVDRVRWLQSHDPFTAYFPGGVKVRYDKLEPAATIIGLFADAGAIIAGDRQREGWMALGPAVFSNIVNKSYLTQLSAITALLDSWNERNLKNLGKNALALAPGQGFRSQTGKLIDHNIRELRSTQEPFWSWAIKKSGGLGLSGLAPSQIDALTAEPLTRDGYGGETGTNVAVLNSLSPIKFSKNRFQPVHKKLYEAGVDVEQVSRELQKIPLTNDELVEFRRFRAGDGALKKDLEGYFFGKNSSYQIDMEESMRMHGQGKKWTDTPVYRTTASIVREHTSRASALMELGQTPVSAGYAERLRKAQVETSRDQNQLQQKRQEAFSDFFDLGY